MAGVREIKEELESALLVMGKVMAVPDVAKSSRVKADLDTLELAYHRELLDIKNRPRKARKGKNDG